MSTASLPPGACPAIVGVTGVVNATGVQLNGGTADLILTETGALQQVPVLGTVTLNE